MVPAPAGATDHVIVVSLTSVAVNCWVCDADKVTVCGLIELVTGAARVIVAAALFVLSAWLVAVTVTVCWLVIGAGAAYSPVDALMVPVAGLIVQVIAMSLALVTVALNCWVCPP